MIQNRNKSMIIGVTGNSGSGKSEVCKILKEKGGYIIDTDKLGHQIIKKGQKAYDEILNYFGKDILQNEEINRKVLGEIVFNNKEKLDVLTKITHKYITEEVKKQIKTNKSKNYIVIDGALLIEAKVNKFCDQVWLVDANINTKIKRIVKRDNISENLAKKRLDKQRKFEDFKNHVDYIIENNSDTNNLKEKVEHILNMK